jgi:hypothetical protein
MNIWGWTHPVELEALMKIASGMSSAVEIGCLHGRSAAAIAFACKGPVYCIDPWNDEHDRSFGSFTRNVSFLSNIVPIRSYNSASLAASLGDVDMVFIDGAHTYEAILADIASWLPFCRKVMCGHDYQNADGGYPDVQRAVTEVFGNRVVVPDGTSIWTSWRDGVWAVNDDLPSGWVTYTDEYGRTDTVDLVWR